MKNNSAPYAAKPFLKKRSVCDCGSPATHILNNAAVCARCKTLEGQHILNKNYTSKYRRDGTCGVRMRRKDLYIEPYHVADSERTRRWLSTV